MNWDESDKDLEVEWNESIKRQKVLNIKLYRENHYQQSISCLKMVEKSEIKKVDVEGVMRNINIVKFHSPLNFAGDKMDDKYRKSQKIDLIKNIKKDNKTGDIINNDSISR